MHNLRQLECAQFFLKICYKKSAKSAREIRRQVCYLHAAEFNEIKTIKGGNVAHVCVEKLHCKAEKVFSKNKPIEANCSLHIATGYLF